MTLALTKVGRPQPAVDRDIARASNNDEVTLAQILSPLTREFTMWEAFL